MPAQPASFTLSTATAVVGAAAGTATVQLVASLPGSPWTATSNATWLHLGPSSASGTGSALVQFSYDANPNSAAQSGSLTIAGLTLTVTQAGISFMPLNTITTLLTPGVNLPYGVAVDSSGNLYIADTGNNLIREWNASTQQMTTLVSTGLNAPHGVAVDLQSNVYIADSYNNAVEEWSPSTQQFTTLVSSGLNFPLAVAVDGQGNVYIADFGNNAIKRWNPISQQVTTLIGSGLSNPTGVGVDALGNVYVADFRHNAIEQWSPVTQQVASLITTGLSFPNAVALDGQGNVYVVDGNNNAIKEWSAASQTVSTLASSGVSGSFGVATDGQGNFYIANTNTNTILKLTSGYLSLPTSVNEGSQAGTDSAPVQVLPASIPLTATSNQSWLTVTGVGGGLISFAFSANTSLSSRSAQITVLGQTVTITQSADVPSVITKTAGDGQSAVEGQAFSTSLQVTVTDASSIPLSGVAVTFTVVPGAGGAGGTFSAAPPVTILTNASGSATAPTLTANAIAGAFTVNASVNTLSAAFTLINLTTTYLGSSSAIVGNAAGSGSVLLLTAGAWSASSNASWLQIGPGSASGVGNALIQFTYSANLNPAAQTGTLTIAGLTFTVTQAGTGYVPINPMTPLVSSGLNNPQGVAVDALGNVYIADSSNNAVKEWSVGTQQVSPLVSSGLNNPSAVAVDGLGNVYIADSGNHAIEKYSPASQQFTTLVSGLSNPSGLAVDKLGNVYFSDTSNNAIDEWNAATQQTIPLVGSGLSLPTGVAVDAEGNVYFADSGNNAIKEWLAASQMVTVLVPSGLNNPTGVAVDGDGNVYIADSGNNAIKQWSAATQQVTALVYSGLSSPKGVAVDGQGNFYVADSGNSAIKKFTPGYLSLSATNLNEPALTGTDSVTAQVLPASILLTASSNQSWLTITGISGGVIGFSFPPNASIVSRSAQITVLGQTVTVTQSADVPSIITKIAGDGQSASAGQVFSAPLQVNVEDSNGIPLPGVPVTFTVMPDAGGASGTFASSPPMPILTDANGNATAPALTAGGIAGTFTVTASVSALSVTFTLTNLTYALGASSAIVGNAAGSGSVLLLAAGSWTASSNASWLQLSAGSASGTGNALIQFTYSANTNATSQTGTLTIAGLTYTVTQVAASSVPITLTTSLVSTGLSNPQGVAVDGSGNVYISDSGDNAIKKWSASTQQVTTLVPSGLNDPVGVAVDSQGNVYFADEKNNALKEWSVATGTVTPVVSNGLISPVGMAVDAQGNLYFSDAGHNAIDQWNLALRKAVKLVTGSSLNLPLGVAVDAAGNVYFADNKNNAIKEWSAATSSVSTLVSSGLNSPYAVAVDGDGNVYIADSGNNAIKEWSPATGQVTVLISTGLRSPCAVAVDGQGNIYVADTGHNAIKKFTLGYLALSATSLTEGAQAGTDSVTAQVFPGSIPLTATSSQSWLTITGTAGGVISFSFSANISLSSRSAQITVLGQTVTVTQSADVPFAITKTAGDGQSTPPGQAFSTPLQVTVTDSNGIALPGAAVTFTVTPGASGASATFASSPSMPILTSSIGIATAPALTANGTGGAFTVTASVNALSVTFTLTNLTDALAASSATVGNTAGSGSVLLLAYGAWTASSNASWLQLSAGSASGTGNALIQFTYSANPNATVQTGTLTIAGLTFTVTQVGTGYVPVNSQTPLVSTGLSNPQGVAVDGSGNVYISDSGDNAIKKWSASTQQVTTLVPSGLNDPVGVAVDSQGNVYFADEKNNALKEWSVATGTVTPVVSNGLISPAGMAVDAQDNLYFSDAGHNAVDQWNAALRKVVKLVTGSSLNLPLGVAVDAAGNVYFADNKNNAIKEWSAATSSVSTLVSSGLNSPYAVAVDGDGNVYIADSGNNAIREWSPATGQVTALVSTGLKFPTAVAVDGQGNIYVADTNNSAIKKFTPGYLSLNATSRSEAATAGTDSISFQALPASLALTATSNQSWLTITGTSGGTIGFSFTANTSVSSRSAQITVLGQTVTVTQSGDVPTAVNKIAGMGQHAVVGQPFATALLVRVTDAAGNGVQGASVTFVINPAPNGASGTFASSPSMPILTNSSGYATAPGLTANSVAGTFGVTASVGTLSTLFGATVTSN